MLVDSDRRYLFPVEPDALWEAFCRVDEYQVWWPWLRRFEPGALEPGARWACSVQPPLPYAVRFDLVLTEVVEGRAVGARVEGDVRGDAHIEIAPDGEGSALRLTSSLAPTHPMLRAVARVARPIASFGHDWVLDTGFRQFTSWPGCTSGDPR